MSSEEAVDRLGPALGGEKKKGSWKDAVREEALLLARKDSACERPQDFSWSEGLCVPRYRLRTMVLSSPVGNIVSSRKLKEKMLSQILCCCGEVGICDITVFDFHIPPKKQVLKGTPGRPRFSGKAEAVP